MTVNLTRIYTRLGDGGETHLGDMSRVPKTHPRIEAYGTVDELNAQLGVALAGGGLSDRYAEWLRRVQNDLFDVGADISVPHGGDRERLRVAPEQTEWLEQACDEVNADLPGAEVVRAARRDGRPPRSCTSAARSAGAPSGARSTAARTINAECVRYLNRLSRPAVHPLPRRQPRRLGRGAAVAARAPGAVSTPTEQGLFPAEHRALRELHAMARQLATHWERLGERLGGEPGDALAAARRRRASCWASSPSAPRPTVCTASRRPRASGGAARGAAQRRAATSCSSATRRCAARCSTSRT